MPKNTPSDELNRRRAKDRTLCVHEFLIEHVRVHGMAEVLFDATTGQCESWEVSGRTIGASPKWCKCADCGKRVRNPRWKGG